jgi:hypothetical protein
MTFPTGQQINTSHLDSDSDDPSLARVDLLALAQAVNQIISGANAASGVMVLDSSALVPVTNINGYMQVQGDISLRPSTGVTNVRNVLRLNQLSVADLGSAVGTTSPTAGDVCYLLDGDAGQACIGAYDGAAWRVLRFQTSVGGAQAALTSTFTLSATADA